MSEIEINPEINKEQTALLEFIEKMEQMSKFQEKIDVPADIDQIWKVFLEEVGNSIDVDVCALFIVDEKTQEFVLKNVSQVDKESICLKEIDLQIEIGMLPWVINRRQPALIPSLAAKNEKSKENSWFNNAFYTNKGELNYTGKSKTSGNTVERMFPGVGKHFLI